jgi:hypothetical protein
MPKDPVIMPQAPLQAPLQAARCRPHHRRLVLRVLFDGRQLEDNDQTLAACGIGPDDTVRIVFRLRGYGPTAVYPGQAIGTHAYVGHRALVIEASRSVRAVEELRDVEDVEQHVLDARPFVVRGPDAARMDARFAEVVGKVSSLEQWAASPQGDHRCLASVLHAGQRSGPPFDARPVTVKEYVSQHANVPEPALYLEQLPVGEHPVLREWLAGSPDELPPVPFGLAPVSYAHCIFAGGPGITTTLHYDRNHQRGEGPSSVDNLFTQCSGSKKVVLWRPCDHGALYPRGEPLPERAMRPGSEGSQAATREEDRDRAPLSESPHVSRICDVELAAGIPEAMSAWPGFAEAHARRLEVILEPGDVLYIPRWWWHKTTSLAAGTAINCWFIFNEN